jgi:hypothetical protein
MPQGSADVHRLSIVIPCRKFNQHVEDTLVSVLENRPPHCDVIVPTAGKYDDPYRLADEVTFVEADSQATPTQLINCGFSEARASIVHLLHPGMRAVEGWTDGIHAHFSQPDVAAVSPVVVNHVADSRSLWLGIGYWSCGVRRVLGRGTHLAERRLARIHVLGPSFAAGFYRHDAVSAVGYFDQRMEPACADIDLALALRALGLRTVIDAGCRVLARELDVRPRATFQTARHLERIYRRYMPASWSQRLLHLAVATAELVQNLPHPRAVAPLCGRLIARLESGVRERQARRLEEAATRLAQSSASSRRVSVRGDFSNRRGKSHRSSADGRRRAA